MQQTELDLENVYDPILDEDGEMTGCFVSTANPDTCILLMTGLALSEKLFLEKNLKEECFYQAIHFMSKVAD